jgi:hypothetical protein
MAMQTGLDSGTVLRLDIGRGEPAPVGVLKDVVKSYTGANGYGSDELGLAIAATVKTRVKGLAKVRTSVIPSHFAVGVIQSCCFVAELTIMSCLFLQQQKQP